MPLRAWAKAHRRLAQHYGFAISPTRPGTPRHKGKVENGIHYVQRNFMAGQQFVDIHVANQRLQAWVQERAGTREHGTTHQAPLYLFQTCEQAALCPFGHGRRTIAPPSRTIHSL